MFLTALFKISSVTLIFKGAKINYRKIFSIAPAARTNYFWCGVLYWVLFQTE